MRCLLLRTTDKKEFLTTVRNYPLLIEYANTFGARLYTIDLTTTLPVLSITELASALCEGEGVRGKIKYAVVKKHLPAQERASKRREDQKTAVRIREYIREQLLKGVPVSLMSIRRHFARHGLQTCTLSNHYAYTRRQLAKQGIIVKRVGHGVYQKKAA